MSSLERKLNRRQLIKTCSLLAAGFILACKKSDPKPKDNGADTEKYFATIAQEAYQEASRAGFPLVKLESIQTFQGDDQVTQLTEFNTDQQNYLDNHGLTSFSLAYDAGIDKLFVKVNMLPQSKLGQSFRKSGFGWPAFAILSDLKKGLDEQQDLDLVRARVIPTTDLSFELNGDPNDLDTNLISIPIWFPVNIKELYDKYVMIAFAENLINFKGNDLPKFYLPNIIKLPQAANIA